jgi:xanthine dehydrogenase accessory factor
MKEILDQVERWVEQGKRVAAATVIATERSTPRAAGAVLAVTEDVEVAGSVSGGCVEGAVVEEALTAIRTGCPKRLTYGIADEDAFAVGLSCGGVVHIFVEPLPADEIFRAFTRAIHAEDPVALVTQVTGPKPGAKMLVSSTTHTGSLGAPGVDDAVRADARTMLEQGRAGTRRYGVHSEEPHESIEVFIQTFTPPPRMYVFGAVDQAAAVVRIGKFLGYRVTVCDARAAFATRQRFPEADEVVVRWPNEFLAEASVDGRTVLCILTHDPKFEIPLLKIALTTPAGYIGAMGSRRTHETRLATLRAEGVSTDALTRIRAPIGLDLGGRTPEEMAIAIAAEIITLRSGRSGGFLAGGSDRVRGESIPEEVPR